MYVCMRSALLDRSAKTVLPSALKTGVV